MDTNLSRDIRNWRTHFNEQEMTQCNELATKIVSEFKEKVLKVLSSQSFPVVIICDDITIFIRGANMPEKKLILLEAMKQCYDVYHGKFYIEWFRHFLADTKHYSRYNYPHLSFVSRKCPPPTIEDLNTEPNCCILI